MSRRRLLAVLSREWLELRANTSVIVAALVIPVVLIGLVASMAWWVTWLDAAELEEAARALATDHARLDPRSALLIHLEEQVIFFMLFVPAIVPQSVTTFSIVSEKEVKSLEPVLTTPITIAELLVGKTAAGVIPAVLICWLSYVGGAIVLWAMAPAAALLAYLRTSWWMGMLLLTPLLALLSGLLGAIVSANARDVKAAQAISGVVVLPIVGGAMAVLLTRALIGVVEQLLVVALLTLLNGALVLLASRVFTREQILTRWR